MATMPQRTGPLEEADLRRILVAGRRETMNALHERMRAERHREEVSHRHEELREVLAGLVGSAREYETIDEHPDRLVVRIGPTGATLVYRRYHRFLPVGFYASRWSLRPLESNGIIARLG